MGCRHSAATRLEVLLDEDDFRSFWQALELGDVLLLSQLHVSILVFWSQCRAHPPLRVSPFLFDILLQFFIGIDTQLCVDSNPPTGLIVLDNWVFWFLLDSLGSLLLPATSESNSFIQFSLKEIVGGARIWFLQIPSQHLSRYNKLGMYHRGWLHYILFDRTSILFVEQAEYRHNTPYPGVFSTFARTMQDVVWSNQAYTDLCDPYSWDSQP